MDTGRRRPGAAGWAAMRDKTDAFGNPIDETLTDPVGDSAPTPVVAPPATPQSPPPGVPTSDETASVPSGAGPAAYRPLPKPRRNRRTPDFATLLIVVIGLVVVGSIGFGIYSAATGVKHAVDTANRVINRSFPTTPETPSNPGNGSTPNSSPAP